MPYAKLAELHSDKVEVRVNKNPLGQKTDQAEIQRTQNLWQENWDFEDLKWCDIVVVNNISNYGGPYTSRVVGKAREFGKFVHFDTDDLLTDLYDEHKLKNVYKEKKLDEITMHMYQHSHLVTVTQAKFAERIQPYCQNVLGIIKNQIDYNLECWNIDRNRFPSRKIRVGWAGGIHHLPDVKIIEGVPYLVNQKVGKENVQWDFYGFPPPGQKDDEWQIDTWENYKKSLLKGFKGQKNYNIHYALPPDKYGIMMANMDIGIAPLQMNAFNDSKCFSRGTKILMHDGTTKLVEDIKIGDQLMGDDSSPRKVKKWGS